MPLRIIYIDLNSYFASVEQAERPELMGRPVAVVPMMAETTCCLAASYPAKACGVRTGTLVKDARKLCPKITFIEADHRKYTAYHHRIIDVVDKCFPIWKVFSIDEMAIELHGREQDPAFARAKALEIKRAILEEIHPALTCSIGIAPNRYVAKIASDMQKPDGLTIIHSEELPERLFGLSLRDFPGIGPRMEERLIRAHCMSARALCHKSFSEMVDLWGSKVGGDFWRLIRGEVLEERETERSSIGHSRVLPPNTRNAEDAWSNLVALLSKAAMRLRGEGFYARSLQLNLQFLRKGTGISHWDKRARFFETQDTTLLLHELGALWAEAPKENILKVGVVLSSLVPEDKHQLSLMEDSKRDRLMAALDSLNKGQQKNLVVYGASSELGQPTQAKIAFGYIPEKDA
ncbi:MAG: DNA polymerase [Deltaproteobacteria bacterium]|nr:DNA polymerase [Deltaproteobacteria bacterium]